MLKYLLAFSLVTTPANAITIRKDMGGNLLVYALKAARAREHNLKVKIDGWCMSACTLYLSVKPSNICVTKRAVFGFHAPTGSSDYSTKLATKFVLRNYPLWVRHWIMKQGGLSKRLMIMPNRIVFKHIKKCTN